MLFRTLFASPALFVSALAQAQAANSASGSDVGGSLLQLLLGLGGVLLLLVGSLWLIKKLVVQRNDGAGLLRVVSAAAVGARERVVIVEVGATWLVLGVAPGRVSALAEIPRQAIPSAAQGDTRGFPEWLKNLSQKKS